VARARAVLAAAFALRAFRVVPASGIAAAPAGAETVLAPALTVIAIVVVLAFKKVIAAIDAAFTSFAATIPVAAPRVIGNEATQIIRADHLKARSFDVYHRLAFFRDAAGAFVDIDTDIARVRGSAVGGRRRTQGYSAARAPAAGNHRARRIRAIFIGAADAGLAYAITANLPSGTVTGGAATT